jgi:hypothetical protein
MCTEGMPLSRGFWSIGRTFGIRYSLTVSEKGNIILKINKLLTNEIFNICLKTHQITDHPNKYNYRYAWVLAKGLV